MVAVEVGPPGGGGRKILLDDSPFAPLGISGKNSALFHRSTQE